MSSVHLNDQSQLVAFGLELAHSRSEAIQSPTDQSARETIAELELAGDLEGAAEINEATSEVNKVVIITRESEQGTLGLTDIFTASQIKDMRNRIHEYLGTDIDSHCRQLKSPPGYTFYVGRLATHFVSTNDTVTSRFSTFERRHTDPLIHATGPLEYNSREYANWANDSMLRQFSTFYQAEFQVTLTGPTKTVEDSRISWERGIAECQFLVLDYIRDQLASGRNSNGASGETWPMAMEDIEHNITNLILNRKKLVTELNAINPMLAQQVDNGIETLTQLTIEVFHRGKMGVPRFRKEPESARRAIRLVETLLIHAVSLVEAREDQAEIPILDL